jgi:DNA polymerase III subunit delta
VKLTADSLAKHLAQRLLPAYLISGDEPLLAGEAADAVRAAARAAGFTERNVHFVERASDWDEARASAANLSLFGTQRLVEIRLASARLGGAGNATLAALLGARDPDTLFLVLAPRIEREAQGAWVQVWPIPPERLVAWLRGRSRQLGLEPSEEALELLAARTEGNLLAAQQELAKLALLVPEGPLTAQSVLAGVADSARFDVFQLGEAVLAGEAARALRVLAGLRAEGTEAPLALWALTRSLRDLWGAREGSAAPASYTRRSAALARAGARAQELPFSALAARAVRADRVLKGRFAGDAWDELALLAAGLCGLPVPPAPTPARTA